MYSSSVTGIHVFALVRMIVKFTSVKKAACPNE